MTHHGELYLRDFLPPRSTYYNSGRFGRLFPDLAPFAKPSPAVRERLRKLGAKDGPMDPQDPAIPPADALASGPDNADNLINPLMSVGFTFLGQFLDHDITLDTTSSFERQQDPESIANFRTPSFELDSIYGSGIAVSPHLYDKSNKARFLIEKLGDAPDAHDDLPRNSQGVAIIGDPRNDENVMLSQLHLAFLKFHNAVEEDIRARYPNSTGERFAEAQRRVRWHYQWIILNQYLPATVGEDLVDDILTNGRRFFHWQNEPFIPVEFSVAAFRFGHSQVRPGYKPNPDLQAAIFDTRRGQIIDGQLVEDLRGGIRDPERFVNWNVFDYGDGAVKPNKLIDTLISTPLFNLPFDAPGTPGAEDPPATLAGRHLLRHLTFSLPSGQDVARAMGEEPLTVQDFDADVRSLKMADSTPLWFYILQEAKVRAAGARLGPVGGRIVAEVIIGLLQGDRQSYMRQHPKWRPEYAAGGVFEIQELLHMAGVPGTRARL